MAKIGFPKGSGKQLKVREKSVKSQGILKWILSDNHVNPSHFVDGISTSHGIALTITNLIVFYSLGIFAFLFATVFN